MVNKVVLFCSLCFAFFGCGTPGGSTAHKSEEPQAAVDKSDVYPEAKSKLASAFPPEVDQVKKTLAYSVEIKTADDTLKVKLNPEVPNVHNLLAKKYGPAIPKSSEGPSTIPIWNRALEGVCIDFNGTSEQKHDYSKTLWTAQIKVDGKLEKKLPVKIESTENYFWVFGRSCTKTKYAQVVKSVDYTLSDEKGKTLATHSWKAPWPHIDLN